MPTTSAQGRAGSGRRDQARSEPRRAGRGARRRAAAGPAAGGTAAGSSHRGGGQLWFRREVVLTVVLAGVAVGLVLVAEDRWRRGLLGVGVVLLGAAVLRLVLPTRSIGMLAVRSRVFDVLTLLAFGAAVIVLTLAVPYHGA
jgi:Protein of unknown function (DUF3017)